MLHKIIAVGQVPFEPYKLSFILLKHLAQSYAGCDGDLVALIVLMILMNNKNKIQVYNCNSKEELLWSQELPLLTPQKVVEHDWNKNFVITENS